MDDLTVLREYRAGEPGPSAGETAAARAALTAAIEAEPARPRPGRRRLWVPVTAAVAVAAAAVVITAVAVQPPGNRAVTYPFPAGATEAQPGAAAAARNVLLTAARTVARAAPLGTGRYWHASAVVGNFVTVGPAGHHYLILEKVADQQWTAPSAQIRSPQFTRALSVQPASPRDRAAWRRDGSPTTWNIDQELTLADPQGYTSGFDRNITAGRGQLMIMTVSVSGTAKTFSFGAAQLSARELHALPANPAQLKALILSGYSASVDPGGSESYLFQMTPALLTLPVTPAVRAALYRMLASLPDVRSLGPVRDAAGQPGVAVALTGRFRQCGGYGMQVPGGDLTSYRFSACTVQQRLVINPHTGQPLAQELRYQQLPDGQTWSAPDRLFSYEIFGPARWTNATPPTPSH